MHNKYLFLHIPKAAGSTLIKIFKDILGNESVYHATKPHHILNSTRLIEMHKLIAGHFTVDQLSPVVLNSAYILTFLRNPVERVISMYYFYRNSPDDTDKHVKHAKQNDLKRLLEIYNNSRLSPFSNWQTFSLSYLDNPEESHPRVLSSAKEMLSKINFIGIHERLVDSIDLMCLDCGWPAVSEVPMVNVSKNRKQVDDMDSKVIELLYEMNSLDIELYDYACTLFSQQNRRIMSDAITKKCCSNLDVSSSVPTKIKSEEEYIELKKDSDNPLIYQGCNIRKEKGTREIIITNTQILSQAKISTTIYSGERAFIEILFESKIDRSDVALGILILDDIANPIYGTNSWILGQKVEVRKNAKYRAVYFMNMCLGDGIYSLTVALHSKGDDTERCFHWIDNSCFFEVIRPDHLKFNGIVNLGAELEVHPMKEMLPLAENVPDKISISILEKNKLKLWRDSHNIKIEIENKSSETLGSFLPYPVYISYHYIDPVTQKVVLFDGERSRMDPPLRPFSTQNYIMYICPPVQKGELLLRITLIQEQLFWFDAKSRCYKDIMVYIC